MQDYYVSRRSSIHRLDARVKVIFTLAFIIFLNLSPFNAWPLYIMFLTIILSVVLYSRIGIGFVLKRALLAAPFVLAALPLIFSRPPFSDVIIFPGVQISYNPEGFGRFAGIAIKSWISVQAAIFLTATTRFPDLLTAFKQLKVPKIFIAIIALMWRYLFVISEEVIHMMRARASRSAIAVERVSSGGSLTWRGRVAGGMAGSLFLRSLERSDRIYAAMLSRGYNGDLPDRSVADLKRKELLILIVGLGLLITIWIFMVL